MQKLLWKNFILVETQIIVLLQNGYGFQYFFYLKDCLQMLLVLILNKFEVITQHLFPLKSWKNLYFTKVDLFRLNLLNIRSTFWKQAFLYMY